MQRTGDTPVTRCHIGRVRFLKGGVASNGNKGPEARIELPDAVETGLGSRDR